MSGHRPFSNLTKDFSPERQARVAAKVQTLKQAMALAEHESSLKVLGR